jgi:hypothetical protein
MIMLITFTAYAEPKFKLDGYCESQTIRCQWLFFGLGQPMRCVREWETSCIVVEWW